MDPNRFHWSQQKKLPIDFTGADKVEKYACGCNKNAIKPFKYSSPNRHCYNLSQIDEITFIFVINQSF